MSARSRNTGHRLSPLAPLALAVLQRPGDVRRVDKVDAVEVGDGAADLEDPAVGTGEEVKRMYFGSKCYQVVRSTLFIQ